MIVGDGELVPEYECREACVFANYNWTQWVELNSIERAKSVAQFRLHSLIEAHVNMAAQAKPPRKK